MGNTYAVADLHGTYGLWSQIRDFLQQDDTLFVLGDCADRNKDGWKIIKEALADRRVKYIRGNHDQFLLDCWKSDWHDNYLWFCNGGYDTFDSVIMDEKAEIYLSQLNRTLLRTEYVNKNHQTILLSHAGYTLLENDANPNSEDLLWDREHIYDRCDWWPNTNPSVYVVHGHTGVTSTPFRKLSAVRPEDTKFNESQTVVRYAHGHKICIDGRCFIKGKIALLDLDTLTETVFSTTI